MENVKFSYFSWNKSSVITQQLLVFHPTESLKSTTITGQDKRIIYIVSQTVRISIVKTASFGSSRNLIYYCVIVTLDYVTNL